MKRSIFYSWQSDLPASGNRNLIEESLERAAKVIRKDEKETIHPVIDRDTAGIDGTPAIADSIFSKIALADVFVADVSLINFGGTGRLTPNPNVLIELGYAIGRLGWARILLVQNTAYGDPDQLPFDLRGRRTVTFKAEDGFNKPEVRGLLQGRFEGALRNLLATDSSGMLPTGRNANVWRGTWSIRDEGAYQGSLIIHEVNATGFFFNLEVSHGSHSGAVGAFAQIVSQDLAYATIEGGGGEVDGELIFRRAMTGGRRTIEIEESKSCIRWHGMRAHFGGVYECERLPWFDAGFLNEIEVARLRDVLGHHFNAFQQCTSDIGMEPSSDSFEAKVVIGGVAGLYTQMESIAMIGSDREVWAAYIDDTQVRYFTNQTAWRTALPKTIEDWRKNFMKKPVIFPELASCLLGAGRLPSSSSSSDGKDHGAGFFADTRHTPN